eukprot:6408068-Amphidinium_carterae.1
MLSRLKWKVEIVHKSGAMTNLTEHYGGSFPPHVLALRHIKHDKMSASHGQQWEQFLQDLSCYCFRAQVSWHHCNRLQCRFTLLRDDGAMRGCGHKAAKLSVQRLVQDVQSFVTFGG